MVFDEVGSRIRRGKGWLGGVDAEEDVSAVAKVWRHEPSPVVLVVLRDRLKKVHGHSSFFDVGCSGVGEEICWDMESFAVDAFCGRDVVDLFGCST